MGRHLFPSVFIDCPTHAPKLTLFNVRIKTKYHTIKKPDGSKTNEWTFQQKAENGKRAARMVVDAIFGGQEAAEFHLKTIEVWPATKAGVLQDLGDPRVKWKGTAE